MGDDRIRYEMRPSVQGPVLELGGPLTVHTVTGLWDRFGGIGGSDRLVVDLSGVSRIDTAGAWALTALEARLAASGGRLEVLGARDDAALVLKNVRDAMPKPDHAPAEARGLAVLLELLGRKI